MDPAVQPLAALLWWRTILLICAILLATEAGVLTFLTSRWRRPWYERLLALAPVGAFVWAILMARQAHEAYVAMRDYATFIRTHYPEEFVWRGGELTAAAEQISRSGSLVIVATIGALALGALLLLTRWRETRRRQVEPPEGDNTDESELEITIRRLGDAEDSMR